MKEPKDKKPKKRVTQVTVRLPWAYTEPGSPGGLRPGQHGLVNAEQLRLMMRMVRKAHKAGRVADAARDAELLQLRHGIRVIEASVYDDVGVYAPADKVIRPRARRR